MNETAHCDKLQQLEQKHLRLIEELEVLNARLEQALASFSSVRGDECGTSRGLSAAS